MNEKFNNGLKYAGYGLLAAGAFAVAYIRSPIKRAGRPLHYLELANKTVIVTGASKGIGYHTAEHLARFDMRVILACRNLEDGELAAAKIREEIQNPNVVAMECDMSSFTSIRSFAANINKYENRITALVNNAAVLMPEEKYTKDGLEAQMGVNYFGHFLLTNLLLPRMETSALQPNSRIVNVSSIFSKYGHLNFDDLAGEYYAGNKLGHFSSKLAMSVFSKDLSKRVARNGINVYAVEPRPSRTQLGRHIELPAFEKFLYLITARPPRKGAEGVADAVVNHQLHETTGVLLYNCRIKPWPEQVLATADDSQRLWRASEVFTGLDKQESEDSEEPTLQQATAS